eukprot:EG_transcript_12920
MTHPRAVEAASASEINLHDLRISGTRSVEDLRLSLHSATAAPPPASRAGVVANEATDPSTPNSPLPGLSYTSANNANPASTAHSASADNIQWLAIPISADSLSSSHTLMVSPDLARSLLPSSSPPQQGPGAPGPGPDRLPMGLHIPGADGARCNHFHNWKRLRSKRGFAYFVCYLCGAKWRTASNYRDHGPSEGGGFPQGGSAPSSPTISPSATLDSLATAKTFESLQALRQNLAPMADLTRDDDEDEGDPAAVSLMGAWDTKQGLFW